MDVYTFDQQAVKILESAIRYLEFEMRTFEDKKELMGTQLKKDLKNIDKFVTRLCAILPKLASCKLSDNTDISGVYMALISYKKGIETTLLIKQKATAWIFDPSEIQLKINLIDKEIQTIESLSTVPHFTLLEPSKVITSIQYVTDTITSEQKI